MKIIVHLNPHWNVEKYNKENNEADTIQEIDEDKL